MNIIVFLQKKSKFLKQLEPLNIRNETSNINRRTNNKIKE
jgi:hypothetical protein